MRVPVRLELGAGHRPTRGYEHNDLHPFDHIEWPGRPWELDIPPGTVDEVLALGFVEHLTYYQAVDTFHDVYDWLTDGGRFLFDVPNYPVWAGYYLDALGGKPTPVPMSHIRKTLFGWQRWPGDEHLYGWDEPHLSEHLEDVGFTVRYGMLDEFRARARRNRFDHPEDAHLYVVAVR